MANQSKSFRQTPIPFRAKNGNPMQYRILTNDGKELTVTRAECLAPAEKPNNPYPQRWFVDEESGLVLRLPRNAESETLARENMQSIWREAKHDERWGGRVVTPKVNDDGEEIPYETADPCDIAAIFEDAELLATLHTALATILTPEEHSLIKAIYWNGKTERQLAPELGLKESKSVNKRKHKILEKLRNHEGLKSFFK